VPPFLLVSLGFRCFVRHVGNGWRVVLGLGAIAIHGAYTSRQRNINQKVEQDLRGKLGLPATGEIYYVQDRPLYQEYENGSDTIHDGTIFDKANVPATEEGGDYVHQYMVILTDYKESVDIGWYQMSSSTDEPDDLVQAGIDEFQNYENQFLKDEDLVRPILMLL